jgi:transcriptional regulator with XRE-family HTH domain
VDTAPSVHGRTRKSASLTQTELAERIGTSQSVIFDLESAEYKGHSMPMLRRIAAALGLSVQENFVRPGLPQHA